MTACLRCAGAGGTQWVLLDALFKRTCARERTSRCWTFAKSPLNSEGGIGGEQ